MTDTIVLSIEDIRAQQLELDRVRKEMAELKRSQIAELMAQVSMLTAEADELDPSGAIVQEQPKRARRAKPPVESTTETEESEPTAEAQPTRVRKPRGEKPAKAPAKSGANDKPTEKAAMTALKDAGEPISIGTWAETLGCEKSVLVPLVSTLMSAKAIKRTGEKRGTKYQVRK
jgi:hypothetical protein